MTQVEGSTMKNKTLRWADIDAAMEMVIEKEMVVEKIAAIDVRLAYVEGYLFDAPPLGDVEPPIADVLAAADALADAVEAYGQSGETRWPNPREPDPWLALIAYRALRNVSETAHNARHGPERPEVIS